MQISISGFKQRFSTIRRAGLFDKAGRELGRRSRRIRLERDQAQIYPAKLLLRNPALPLLEVDSVFLSLLLLARGRLGTYLTCIVAFLLVARRMNAQGIGGNGCRQRAPHVHPTFKAIQCGTWQPFYFLPTFCRPLQRYKSPLIS